MPNPTSKQIIEQLTRCADALEKLAHGFDHNNQHGVAKELMHPGVSDQEQQALRESLIDFHARLRAHWQLPLSAQEHRIERDPEYYAIAEERVK